MGCFLSVKANAQESASDKSVGISFVKTYSEHSSDSLYFNVLKIQNLSNEPQNLDLEFHLPSCFTMMTSVPTQLKLKPNSRSNISFRVSVLKNAISNLSYSISAVIKNSAGEIKAQSTASVKIKVYRSWELLSPVAEINLFTGNESQTNFSVPLRNNGNQPERINLKISPPEGYQTKSGKRTIEEISVDLPAGKDSVFQFGLSKSGKNKLLRTQDEIQITASNSLGEFRKQIRTNSYTNRYEYVQEKISLDNFVEVSHQVTLPNSPSRTGVQASGKIPLHKKERLIQYSFMNYDATNSVNFWQQSYYNLNYTDKKLIFGVGQSYSSLGVDLYNTHGFFGNYKLNLNKTNQLEFYASAGLEGDINCGAAGYQFQKNDLTVKISSGYSTNEMYKQNIGSFAFSSQFPLGSQQRFVINLRGVNRENQEVKVFSTQGLQGNFSYQLNLGKHFNFQARNLFNTANFNRTNQTMFGLDLIGTYKFSKNRELCLTLGNEQRIYNAGQTSKQMGQENKVDDCDYVMYYMISPNQKTSFKIGPWYKRLLYNETGNTTLIDVWNVYVDIKKSGNMNYYASLITGIRQKTKTFPFADGIAITKKINGNVHFTGGLNGTFWGLNVQYDYGPPQLQANIRDMDYWLIRISPRLQRDFFHEKLLCQVTLDYNADWARNYKYLNIRTNIEAIIGNNWRIGFDGYASTFGKLSFSTLDKDLRFDLRFSLRKDFNWGKKKAKTKYYNVDTFFFQDDNKNGIFDPNERGISNGFLKMVSDKSGSDTKEVSLSPVISGKSGKVSYAKVPQGEYQIDLSRLVNDDGYFNFNNSHQTVRVKKDTVFYIPFVKAYMIRGNLKITLAAITSGKINSAKNIRVTATDSKGQQYSALTDMAGNYMLPVGGNDTYIVSINNPFGSNVEVKNNDSKVEFTAKDEVLVNFEFIEKSRKVKMKSSLSSALNQGGDLNKIPTSKAEIATVAPMKTSTPSESAPSLRKIELSSPSSSKSGAKIFSKADKNNVEKNKNELATWIYKQISTDGKTRMSYWVIGVYKHPENRDRTLEQLKLKKIAAKWFYNDAKGLYYVYLKEQMYSK